MFRFRSAVPALGVLAFTLVASAGSLSTVTGPNISFRSEGKGATVISIEGTIKVLSAEDDGTTLKLKTDATNIRTGNGMRDGHITKDWVKVHPIELKIAKSALKIPAGTPTSGAVPAKLLVNGEEKGVKVVNYTAKNVEGGYAITGNFKFDLKDHLGGKVPEFSFIKADTALTVTAAFNIKEK